jgi:SIR2-like protein
MSMLQTEFDPLREANELRSQLASEKRRLAFLFGAGTSQLVGLEGLAQLTTAVAADLAGQDRAAYDALLQLDTPGNLETVLSRLRLSRELAGADQNREIDGISGKHAVTLDRAVCRSIQQRVGIDPPGGIVPHFTFGHWVKSLDRTFPVELFTTNYDVIFERGFESAEAPYFDGFVGTVEPFFLITAVDAAATTLGFPPVPRNWLRLWKLHGSLNWRSRRDPLTGVTRIVRSMTASPSPDDDLVIYPSHQKYADSRRLPFLAYHDRLRHLVTSGEALLVICGYSFSDQHLNEVIYQGLRSNSRLAVTALVYDKVSSPGIQHNLIDPTIGIRNLTVYGPDGASVGGRTGTWKEPKEAPPASSPGWLFWNGTTKEFTLGDFRHFVEFLQVFMGVRMPDIITAASPPVIADGTSMPGSAVPPHEK